MAKDTIIKVEVQLSESGKLMGNAEYSGTHVLTAAINAILVPAVWSTKEHADKNTILAHVESLSETYPNWLATFVLTFGGGKTASMTINELLAVIGWQTALMAEVVAGKIELGIKLVEPKK